jgi:type I phosphodiesterase/nucleotide pyrophosphatase
VIVDDLVLALQRLMDRIIRRLRRGHAPERTRRRLLIVQIDGLSRLVLARALASGHMPFLADLIDRHGYRLAAMSVGLPTSTPAFQMAAMYGVRPDIPGFHYYDRDRPGDIHFPRVGHAAWVEAKQASGRRGILHGGSAYGCVFTGGADNSLFSFATLTRPTGRGLVATLSGVVVLAWVIVKSLTRTVVELVRAILRFIADPLGQRRGWRWLTIQIGLSVWVRGFFTYGVARDLYAGTPAVYVNYLDYDVAAHALGPQSRQAIRTLRRVDRAIRQIWCVMRRVPEHQYDFYVLADHGQAASRPYRDLTGGRRLERWLFDELLHREGAGVPDDRSRSGLAHGIRAHRRAGPGVFQRFLNYLDEDFLRNRDPEAYQRNGIRVISAGPNAFLYVLDAREPLDAETLEHRLPGVAEELSRSRGVGFVLARSTEGPVCFRAGERYQLSELDPGPFAGRPDWAAVVDGIIDLMSMPSAGDLVIYGIDAPQGHVSFIPEMGAHAGPSPEEMQTFILHPPTVTLPPRITHPIQLYDHFIRYRGAS